MPIIKRKTKTYNCESCKIFFIKACEIIHDMILPNLSCLIIEEEP